MGIQTCLEDVKHCRHHYEAAFQASAHRCQSVFSLLLLIDVKSCVLSFRTISMSQDSFTKITSQLSIIDSSGSIFNVASSYRDTLYFYIFSPHSLDNDTAELHAQEIKCDTEKRGY